MKSFSLVLASAALIGIVSPVFAGERMSTEEMDQMEHLISKRWTIVMKEPVPTGGISLTRRISEAPEAAGGRCCKVTESHHDDHGTFQKWHCD